MECGWSDLDVEPSQGTHFFHNLTSLGIGYFTTSAGRTPRSVDWAVVGARWSSRNQTDNVAHYELAEPLEVLVDGRRARGRPQATGSPDRRPRRITHLVSSGRGGRQDGKSR